MVDVPRRDSPARRRFEALGGKWTMLTVLALGDGALRFGELQRRVDGVSQKMLTQTLRALERERLVTRTVHAEVPPRVEYALTADGRGAHDALAALAQWSAAAVSRDASPRGPRR